MPHDLILNQKETDLLKVLDISRQLVTTIDLEELLQQIEMATIQVLNCERATVFVHDRDTNELYSYVSDRDETIRFPANKGIAGECFQAGETSSVPDAYADPRFNRAIDIETGFTTRNLLSCPLKGHDQTTVGVLQALNKSDRPFDEWDESLIEAFGAQCGVAIQRQLLLVEFAEKQRIQRDLNIAHTIQQGLLPKCNPVVKGFDIGGWNKAAEETGGDFYDYYALSNGNTSVTVADVTGHGIGPAIIVAETRALLRASLASCPSVEQCASSVNVILAEDLPDSRFVTAFIGIVSPDESEVTYTSAGHGPLLFYRSADDTFEELPTHGMPLGIIGEISYTESTTVKFATGDMLLAFTDGFFEWEDLQGEAFGTDRICEIVREFKTASVDEIIQKVYERVQNFTRGVKQLDDLTAVIIKKTE